MQKKGTLMDEAKLTHNGTLDVDRISRDGCKGVSHDLDDRASRRVVGKHALCLIKGVTTNM